MLLVRPSTSSVAQYEERLQPVRYRRILVPLDGSQRRRARVADGRCAGRAPRRRLVLLHVVTKPELIQRMTEEEIELVDKVVARNQRRTSTTSISSAAGYPCARKRGF